MMDTKTFETDCGKFFRRYFGKIEGYGEHSEINGKFPDFKIEPEGRAIFFEIYRPEAHKIKELKSEWPEKLIHGRKVKYTHFSLNFDGTKSIICHYIKNKKIKGQLPENKPNVLVIDLSTIFEEAVAINDFLEDGDIVDIFNVMPTLSGISFYGLPEDHFNMKSMEFRVNPTLPATINGLSKEEKKIIEGILK